MKISIGAAQFGLKYGLTSSDGPVPKSQVLEILKLGRDHGVSFIDTAQAYGNCEEILGSCGIQGWEIVTKLPKCTNITPIQEWVEQSVNASLRRLNIRSIYGLLLHHPLDLFGVHGKIIYNSLERLKEQGKIKKIGISIYDPAELDQILNEFNFDIVQAPCNLLDRRIIETGWADRLVSMNIELHTRSAFLQGLLINKHLQSSMRFNHWKIVWNELEEWQQSSGISIFNACLQFPLSQPTISRVIVGVDNIDQFKQIVQVQSIAPASLPQFSMPLDLGLINPGLWAKT